MREERGEIGERGNVSGRTFLWSNALHPAPSDGWVLFHPSSGSCRHDGHSFQPCEYGKTCTSVSCDNGGAFKEDEQGDSPYGEMVSACGISAYGYALYFV